MRRPPRMIVHVPRTDAGTRAREVEAHGEPHALVPLGDAVHGRLWWEQPRRFRKGWALVSERGAHLLLHGRGFWRWKLQVETPAETWMLQRTWGGAVTLADTEGRELASVPPGWFWRWRLELPSGPALTWRRHWLGGHTLEDEEGHELLRLQPRFAFLRFEAEVTLADAVRSRTDLLELLAVTFFAWLSRPRRHGH